jgi:hypothetical protein
MHAAALALALLAQSETDLLAPPPKPFVAPGRLFSVQVPGSWEIVLTKDPYTIQFAPQTEGDAMLWIRRVVVPEGAHPRQVRLQALEQRLRKMPGWKQMNTRDVRVGGKPGAAVIGVFSHQGNIQYPRALEEVFVVAGNEAFIFHFECFEPYAAQFAVELNKFYASFVPRPPGEMMQMPDGNPEKLPGVEAVPF